MPRLIIDLPDDQEDRSQCHDKVNDIYSGPERRRV